MITPVTLDHPSASPKPATLELRSGAAVRSSDLVGRLRPVHLNENLGDNEHNDTDDKEDADGDADHGKRNETSPAKWYLEA